MTRPSPDRDRARLSPEQVRICFLLHVDDLAVIDAAVAEANRRHPHARINRSEMLRMRLGAQHVRLGTQRASREAAA